MRLNVHRHVSRLHRTILQLRALFSEEFIALLLAVVVLAVPAGATTRFENRSLYMNNTLPGATTSYTVSLSYMTPAPVGSLDMLFCVSPIPYDPCEVPPGLDVSNAVLSNQTGEIGFSILSKNTNHIILTRTPGMILTSGSASSYTFDAMKNPTDTSQSFSIRLQSHSSTDATGPLIDFGSVKGQVSEGITIQTQVPPMLYFCAARQVATDCTSTDDTYYTDMGNLSDTTTLTAQSQMSVGTNASGGFAITANGTPLAAGTNVIDNIPTPTNSTVGKNQFGINLVENNQLNLGHDPEGTWANAVASSNYSQPNKFMYVPGDVIAYSPNVSLMKRFTVSYIVNVNPQLRAGVYATTINYIASGRF